MINLIKLVDCPDDQRHKQDFPAIYIFGPNIRATWEVHENKGGETKSENWTHLLPFPQKLVETY